MIEKKKELIEELLQIKFDGGAAPDNGGKDAAHCIGGCGGKCDCCECGCTGCVCDCGVCMGG